MVLHMISKTNFIMMVWVAILVLAIIGTEDMVRVVLVILALLAIFRLKKMKQESKNKEMV